METTQWILTRITKDKKAFIIGNPSASVALVRMGTKNAKAQYPGQTIVLRDYEAFKQTPVPQKYL